MVVVFAPNYLLACISRTVLTKVWTRFQTMEANNHRRSQAKANAGKTLELLFERSAPFLVRDLQPSRKQSQGDARALECKPRTASAHCCSDQGLPANTSAYAASPALTAAVLELLPFCDSLLLVIAALDV